MLRIAPVIAILIALCGCGPQLPKPIAEEPVPKPASLLPDAQPLTAKDVDLYIGIMRAAAEKIRNPDESDRMAIEYMRRTTSGAAPVAEQVDLLVRATALAASDTVIAREQGTEDRYMAVKARVEGLIGAAATKSVGPHAIRAADMKLLEARRAEIEPLQRELGSILIPMTRVK